MVVQDFEEQIKVRLKLNKLLQLDVYYDHILMDYEEFMQKYDYYGWGFTNFFEVRFPSDINVIDIIQDFYIWEEEAYLLPIQQERSIDSKQSYSSTSCSQSFSSKQESFTRRR